VKAAQGLINGTSDVKVAGSDEAEIDGFVWRVDMASLRAREGVCSH
jgi:hypothetical protein